jgi:sRNA-binding regulator protein Hfq
MNDLRQDQIAEGRRQERQTLHARPEYAPNRPDKPRFDRGDKPKNKSGATGHEAFLKALVATGGTVLVKKATDGSTLQGVLKHTDRYTLTVSVKGYNTDGLQETDVVIYKHAIEEFCSLTPRRADPEEHTGNV